MAAVARHDAAMTSSSAELTAWRNAAAEAQGRRRNDVRGPDRRGSLPAG